MTYRRVVKRNYIEGDYQNECENAIHEVRTKIAGDLRRMEEDQSSPQHVEKYARAVGITKEQVLKLFDLFFDRNATMDLYKGDTEYENDAHGFDVV